MAEDPINSGGFKISEGPVTSSRPSRQRVETELAELPRCRGGSLLLAIPKTNKTLFVCWSVDWEATFADERPSDRTVHLRIKSPDGTKTVPVEPMSGTCSVDDLIPGELYHVELGYYAPADSWHGIASANDVMMPLLTETAEEQVEVASLPFHLSFQRLVESFGTSKDEEVARQLAELQYRAAMKGEITPHEREILRRLGLSAEDLQRTVERKAELTRVRRVRQPLADFFSSPGRASPGGSSWP